MAAAPIINVGERTYLAANDDFGVVVRPSFLGLQNAPVVEMDDGTLQGFAGERALEDVVPVATKKNLKDEPVDVPLDVRIVGIQVMNGMGIHNESQAAMFTGFRALTKAQRTALVEQWEAAAAGSAEQQEAFVQAMVAQFTSQ